MPKTRSVAAIAEGREFGESTAGPSDTENSMDTTVVNRFSEVEEMERQIAEEEQHHQREVELRQKLLAMRVQHRKEIEALEKQCVKPKCSSSIKEDDTDDAYQGQPYSFRDIEEGIEEYDGTASVSTWLSDLEATATMARWTERQKAIMCRKKLTGTAKAFIVTLQAGIDYQQLKWELQREFGEVVRASDVHRQLTARRRGNRESALDYVYAMQKIAQPIQLDEQSICEYIADSYTNDEKLRATLYEAQTIGELKSKLKFLERAASKEAPKRPLVREQRGAMENAKKRNCFSCGSSTHQLAEYPTKQEGPTCFKCGATGHRAKECANSRERKPQCFACGDIGHVSGKCTKKSTRVQTLTTTFPEVHVTIRNKENKAVVDTCSEVTLMRYDLFQELKLSPGELKPSVRIIRGYGGKQHNVCGEVTIEAGIDEVIEKIQFVVVPLGSIDSRLLIGLDVLGKVNYVIQNGSVKITKQVKHDKEPPNEDYHRVLRITCNDVQELDVPSKYRSVISGLVNNYNPSTNSNTESEMRIRMEGQEVVRTIPRRLAPLEKEIVKKQVREWLSDGIIQPSRSPYASAVVVVPKKDGSYRMCVDYREVNKLIVRDSYPMPNVEEQIDQLADARVYSVLDLKNSYFHVKVEEKSRQYTSFVTSDGQYEFLRAPFGLCISGNAFGRFINTALQELITDGTIMAFVDDIIIPATDEEHGLTALRRVLEVARYAGLQFNWKKCVFLKRRVEYLGYTIYDGRIEPSSQKIEKIPNYILTRVKKLSQAYCCSALKKTENYIRVIIIAG
ncbi:uncharacterized protein LOC131292791 [Anopheles ziemanni]|uniref:uncharacterized protein LOC131271142 n=1 Tax=Anopheles coustani TaxID=139045 RepID=UPI002659E162|nr:uncharacterized protein LOC131271142 [Anopheles coustani]XP_058176857.1 uncharacterized protein LOC131292791 [Anopheles ziemanni]